MKPIDPDTLRALVRQELVKRLGPIPLPPRLPSDPNSTQHPSHLDVLRGGGSGEEHDFSTPSPCLIEPHRLCSNSGYCKKLGY